MAELSFNDDVHLDPAFHTSSPISQHTLSFVPHVGQSSRGTEPFRPDAKSQQSSRAQEPLARKQRLQGTWELKVNI